MSRRVAVLAPRRLALAVGSAAALRLSRSGPVAVVIVRELDSVAPQIPSPPPTPGAARIAAEVRRRGHPAAASWRLVRCSVTTVAEASELLGLFADESIPAVFVPVVSRCHATDALLEECDRVIVAADDVVSGAVADLAVEAAGAGRVSGVSLAPVGVGTVLAHAGIGCPPQWVSAIDAALADESSGHGQAAGGGGNRPSETRLRIRARGAGDDSVRADSRRTDSGQAIPMYLALMVAILGLAVIGLAVASASLALDRRQAVADVAALAGADALRLGSGVSGAIARARGVARLNGSQAITVVPDSSSPMPVRIRVRVIEPIRVGAGRLAVSIPAERSAEAMVVQPVGLEVDPGPGDYGGPFAWRQGKPMRPDVADAFDRMSESARRAGIDIAINSAWRSTAEQARLFAAHPDPKWVARPGHSLHRLGTELDLGPDSAWAWLAGNAGRFGFLKRYAWEPWHFGYTRSPGSTSVGWGSVAAGGSAAGAGSSRSAGRVGSLPGWVPERFARSIIRASIAHGVSAAVLAAQIRAESDFNPGAVSTAGARGIAQLMPEEARRLRVDPFDPGQAIDAQARLMRELLARFGSVPLALAAYNAGPSAVARCGCVPPYPETRAYVARILAWLRAAREPGLVPIRLVA